MKINEDDIVKYLKSNNVYSDEYNYYIFGSKIYRIRWIGIVDFFLPIWNPQVILNVTEFGVLIIRLLTNKVTFIDIDDVIDIAMKSEDMGIGYKIRIKYKKGKKKKAIVISASKHVVSIKSQGKNLEEIKRISQSYEVKKNSLKNKLKKKNGKNKTTNNIN